jgi:hypothetical protein
MDTIPHVIKKVCFYITNIMHNYDESTCIFKTFYYIEYFLKNLNAFEDVSITSHGTFPRRFYLVHTKGYQLLNSTKNTCF